MCIMKNANLSNMRKRFYVSLKLNQTPTQKGNERTDKDSLLSNGQNISSAYHPPDWVIKRTDINQGKENPTDQNQAPTSS